MKRRTCILAGLGLVAALAARAEMLPVTNGSFTGYSTDGWSKSGSANAYNGAYGGDANDNLPADGSCAYLRYDSSYLKQTLSEELDEQKIYTLTVDTARASDAWSGGSGIELYAADGSAETSLGRIWVGSHTAWVALSLQVAGRELAGHGGRRLGVKLLGGWSDRSHFDSVRVEKADPAAAAGYLPPAAIPVPDFSFETTGAIDASWAGGSPHVWDGGGWPMGSGSYGQAPTHGSRVGANSAYQLLTNRFVRGARYTLTADASLRGDRGDASPVANAAGLEFFREDQFPGLNTTFGTPAVGTLDGTVAAAGNPPGLNGTNDWSTVTLMYIASSADAGYKIGVMVNGSTPFYLSPQPVWDNVRLSVELPRPPGGLMLVR